MKRSEHRVIVWAGGVNGVPVTCTCGWKVYAKTTAGGYSEKRDHERENQS